MKLTRNKKPVASQSAYEVEIECTNMQVAVDNEQYMQLFNIIDRLAATKSTFHCTYFLKPIDRPGSSPSANKQWWKYACKLALAEPRYIALFKLNRITAFSTSATESTKMFSKDDAIRFRVYEERIPFEPLKAFRQKAFIEMAEEARQQSLKSKSSTSSSPSSWWGGWLRNKNDGTLGDTVVEREIDDESQSNKKLSNLYSDISIESIISKLNSTDGTNIRTDSESFLKLRLTSSSTLLLSKIRQPIVEASMSLAVSFLKTSSGISFNCDLKDVFIMDKCTVTPTVDAILSVQGNSPSQWSQSRPRFQSTTSGMYTSDMNKPTLSICYESNGSKSKLKICSLPIILSLNRFCINTLLNAFSRPKNKFEQRKVRLPIRQTKNFHVTATKESSASQSHRARPNYWRRLNKRISTAGLDRLVSHQSEGLEILFEASAPKIIIPEDSSANIGYLLLDTGNLTIQGFIGPTGMSLNISVTDINAAMPLSVHDKLDLRSLYLIKVRHFFFTLDFTILFFFL
jgi:hypothetical protein